MASFRELAFTAAVMAVSAFFHSCSSTGEKADKTSDLSAEEESPEHSQADQNRMIKTDDRGLPWPATPTAQDTLLLVTTVSGPKPEKIRRCVDELSARNAESANEDELQRAPTNLSSLVSQDLQSFHFCFFQLVTRLDQRLQVGGPLMSEVASVYFETMKGLWILAQSLDQVTGSKRYFAYLRVRYVQISKEIFGRDIEVVAPPLGERPGLRGTPEKRGAGKTGAKAQSTFED